MVVVLHFPVVIACLLELMVTYFNVDKKTASYSLKEHEGYFLGEKISCYFL